VHKCNIGVNQAEEVSVFDEERYWSQMPIKEGVKDGLNKLKKELGLKVYIFSWRPWGKGKFNITKLTKRWLKTNEIKYNGLFIEKNQNRLINNRYYISKRYKIQYFIEDELNKAISLSNICRFVFLINHNYNQTEELPCNVFRVNDWNEIINMIKIM
jgi:uncharacterized HAD superfamily protein